MTLDEMWERLVQHQPYADQKGYGPEWARMCEERTPEAAWALPTRITRPAADAAEAAWAAWARAALGAAGWAVAEAVAEAVKWIEKAEGKE